MDHAEMDVDGEAAAAVSRAMDTLENVLPALASSPFSSSLHYQCIAAATIVGFQKELNEAREGLVTYLAAPDDVWLPLLQNKVDMLADSRSAEAAEETDDLFVRASIDYFSIPILKAYLTFLVSQRTLLRESRNPPENYDVLFSRQAVMEKAVYIVQQGAGHLTEGHQLWEIWREWMEQELEQMKGEERDAFIQEMHTIYLERIKIPHATHEQTFASYSTFVTTYLPTEQYEALLVDASKQRQPAVKSWNLRERHEASLNTPEAYSRYIQYEKSKLNKGGNPAFVRTLYERAIAHTAKQYTAQLQSNMAPYVEGQAQVPVGQAEEAWLVAFWEGLVEFLRELDAELEVDALRRAVRSVPSNGDMWCAYILALERLSNSDKIPDVYARAIGTNLLSPQSLTAVVIATAGSMRRKSREVADEEDNTVIVDLLQDGITRVRQAGGDPRLKLEKFLVTVLMDSDEPDVAAILEVWEAAVKAYNKHWHVWTAFTDFLTTSPLKAPDRARKAFKNSQGLFKAIDYPEMVFEAWIAFEEVWGTKEQLQLARNRVRKMGGELADKRAKDAQKAAAAAAEATQNAASEVEAILQQATEMSAEHAVAEESAPVVADVTMEIGGAEPQVSAPGDSGSGNKKRKAEEGPDAQAQSKKAKPDKAPPLKRDRENSTVFVSGLWKGVEDKALAQFFKHCGDIREIKITELDDVVVATVEFQNRESVPGALTRDKKRIDENEISVHMAWQSTLYVTNFPEKSDDAFIREMFGQYGVIFDVRWPSKKFKSTRRFCYVQYVTPASAQAALELHGRELEPGMNLNVYISNPERKKERTDAGADQREVYVAGLAKSTKREDLEGLFKQFGTIKDVRMALDHKGLSKGFAFVEFEAESSAVQALGVNNHELKNRRIAVTLADSRASSRREQPESGQGRKNELLSRSVRLRNLPPGTQEGLLQQTLEKLAAVKMVEVFQSSGEAVVELENVAEAGKLLLMTDGIQFNDRTLTVSEELFAGNKSSRPSKKAPAASSSTSSFVPRAAKARPRAGLGHKGGPRKGVVPAEAAAAAPSAPAPPSAPAQRDGAEAGKDQAFFRNLLG
ncbi:hypothetical protein BOTBODRAFT_129777 [Botryobasidium botryosum FD-172 SS1]|uniref:U4/U6 snRNA-associated-splicing factor PRP24 n=1 Tax=Botryobasidium botryosum (strain FD-172 SS1) TaxID=930990 RepID=A0A067MMU8_BOTB1|nr:hypothetical protein BOTBODRAFT_129777 [Botryobasidium botryosum FD-172 SS1]